MPCFEELENARKVCEGAKARHDEAKSRYTKILDDLYVDILSKRHVDIEVKKWAICTYKEDYPALLESVGKINTFLQGKGGQLVGLFIERVSLLKRRRKGIIGILGSKMIDAFRNPYDTDTYSLFIPLQEETLVYSQEFHLSPDSEFANAQSDYSRFDKEPLIHIEDFVTSDTNSYSNHALCGFTNNPVSGHLPPYSSELLAGTESVLRFAEHFLWNWRTPQPRGRPETIDKLVKLCQK
ncbi:hypothetical protein HYX14_01375 [Candidatus Woesearchaeota archaeon]|nr:hypothetical protein [Candidatus Woesearchaeota archaeon]